MNSDFPKCMVMGLLVLLSPLSMVRGQETPPVPPVPPDYRGLVSPEAYQELATFKQGSTLDLRKYKYLLSIHNKASEEHRYDDAMEVRLIRELQRETVAALWRIVSDPNANFYYLPKYTAVEEREKGALRPFFSKEPHYKESSDDLAGLRVVARRQAKETRDNGMDVAAIFPVRWTKGVGVVPVEAPDNLRVFVRLVEQDKDGQGMVGMSFSLRKKSDGSPQLRPEVYSTPFSTERFRTSTRTVVSSRSCLDCHAGGYRLKLGKFASRSTAKTSEEFRNQLSQMEGYTGLLEDAKDKGATAAELQQARDVLQRPEQRIYGSLEMKAAVLRLWDEVYFDKQPYLDDREGRRVEYHENHGFGYLSVGRAKDALHHFDQAIGRTPRRARLYTGRAGAYADLGDPRKAVSDLERALNLDAADPRTYAAAAWLHATAQDKTVRDGRKALRYARKACELTEYRKPAYLEALAAASAEVGDFAEAIKWQEKALTFAGYEKEGGEGVRQRLERYKKKQTITASGEVIKKPG